ncbi:anthranilate synthase component I family protein [Ferruginibacter sp.]
MNTNSITFSISNFTEFRIKMLNWANRFNIFCLLDNQHYNFSAPAFECLLAAGCRRNISAQAGNAFETLRAFTAQNKGWLFGHFGYDLKNETEQLESKHFDGIGFDDLHFFEPEIVVQLSENKVMISSEGNAQQVFNEIENQQSYIHENKNLHTAIDSRINKETYIDIIEQLRRHILRGDCYEINFCQEFYAEAISLDAVALYHKLTTLSPNPFAALYKVNDRYCICASPERYLKKEGSRIISQPIKGTSKRNLQDEKADAANKNYLTSNQKEKSENVMVVDLVRNDLSKVCKEGTVKVDELFGVYSFPQVHQMISTISGELKEEVHWIDIIKATFPMGSMTGAPKKRVMELIEQYEQTKRGLFAGSIGYINPQGDFDFNVVIRSIFYNAGTKYLSFQAGGGITFYSEPEKEYEESLLKAAAMMKVLE